MSLTGDRTRTSVPLSTRRLDAMKMLKAQFRPQRVALAKPVNVGLVAERAAAKFGRVPVYLDQPFAWDPDQRVELDYVEFAELVDQFAAVMKAAGVKRWDRVVIVKTPNYDIQALAWAAARIGAIPALLSARLDPDIINILLERLQAKFIVTDPAVAEYARLDAARLKYLNLTAIASIDGGIPVEDLWNSPIPAPSPLKDDEPMMITHTSSTTGVSKLADCCAKGVSFNAFMESIFPGFHTPDELFASAISHVHVRAAITQMASFSRGTPLLGIGKPDDETIMRLFPRYRPTILESHPNNFMGWERLIDDPSEPFSSFRLYFNSFDAMHPRTIQALLDASKRDHPIWLQCYGMTETQVVSVRPYTRGSFGRLKGRDSRSVGWEVPGIRARIADPETGERQADQSKPGMIQVKTPARALSFIGTPEKFAERRHGKWFDTGDWGRRGRFQQIEILDRIADRIEGVESCLWIEDVLLERITNAEEIVVVPDAKGRPVPVICMRDGKALDPEVWRKASAGITGLGEPLEVTPDDLQRTATVKARRYLLTEMIKNRDEGREAAVAPDVVLRDGA
ncbi:class I adenylate-forming enzyme family protein [Streptomyces sp. NPDC051976]|uniref:class I adenylate-forming enzyme family protein n=1 Tax=Streptomyces sp. NPDC051976 TaxID=3154947 RepID=UPI003442C4EA